MKKASHTINHQKLESVRKVLPVLTERLKSCSVCPRSCAVDRSSGMAGYCRAGLNARVYSHAAHHGEEPPISGTMGSGTIFFSGCNMKCVYCQNFYFSQLDKGTDISVSELAEMMIELQEAGCHNINLVSPTHFVPQIVTAIESALLNGLTIPIAYNTGGYDSLETIKLLKGIVDIYMPDMRYSDDSMAKKFSDADDYVKCNRQSIVEMQSQVGDLLLGDAGVATSGLIIRLLALPENVSGTLASLNFIHDNVSPNAYLSIMSQYRPIYEAGLYSPIDRRISTQEYKNIVDEASRLGLNNGWIQQAPEERFLGINIRPKKEMR